MALTQAQQLAVDQSFDDARVEIPPNGGVSAIGQQPAAISPAANVFLSNSTTRAGKSIAAADTWESLVAAFDLSQDVGAANSPYRGFEGFQQRLDGALFGVSGVYSCTCFLHVGDFAPTGGTGADITVAFFRLPAALNDGGTITDFVQVGPAAELSIAGASGGGYLHVSFGAYFEAGDVLQVFIKASDTATYDLHPSAISVFQIR